MTASQIARGALSIALSTALLAARAQEAQPGGNAAPMQLPADGKALRAATDLPDPGQRLAALKQFLHDFPDSKRATEAHRKILQVLLASFPEKTRDIHKQAAFLIDHADGAEARRGEENAVAYDLAEAEPHGVDLKAAEKWAKDAVAQDTEADFDASMKKVFADQKEPLAPPAKLHSYYAVEHDAYLQTLAEVYFHEGKIAEANATLDQAAALDPTDGSVFATRGEIALAAQRNADALNNLELALLYGGITPALNTQMQQLFTQLHGGGAEALNAELDARYRQLFRLPYTPVPAPPVSTGRTALLELFTGAGCEPCAAADLATDGILESYPRKDVVVLVYDMHIPRPDPLANPDSKARADFYDVHFTPTGFVDGAVVDHMGGQRDDSGEIYKALAKRLDAQLARPSGVRLALTLSTTASPIIHARATVSVADPAAMKQQLTAATSANSAPSSAPSGDVSGAAPKLLLRMALVQREISYSGENGIRFHRMVVRALAKPSEIGAEVQAGTGPTTVTEDFDPPAITQSLSAYLQAFARHSDRFGQTKFLSTDTSLPENQLAVAAWVEDARSHTVLQATFAPVQAAAMEAAR